MILKTPGFLSAIDMRFQAEGFIAFFRKDGTDFSSAFRGWSESKDFHPGDRTKILALARGLMTPGGIPGRESKRA